MILARLPRACVILAAVALATEARAQANLLGQWSPLFHTGEQATDCAVLRGNGDSTVVLFYDYTGTARVLLWNAAAPTQSPIVRVPSPGPNLHEGGHCMLPDGRFAVFGGTVSPRFNSPHTYLFDPRQYMDPGSRGWTQDDDMHFRRVASNAVPLADGTALVQSGVDHYSLPLFGGHDGTTTLSAMRELTTSYGPSERWAERPNPSPPSAREDARIGFAYSSLFLFGGRSGATASNDGWLMQRRQQDNGVRWTWAQILLLAGNTPPTARSAHGMVVKPASCDSLCDTVWVYGGRDGNGQALGDVWRLVQGSRAQNRYRWESVAPQGEGPGRRSGHVAVYDPGPPNSGPAYPRMLVFGGRDSTGALCDNRVWSLTLRPPHRWSALTAITAGPAPRTDAVGVLVTRARFPDTKPKRLFLFGGEGTAGTLADTWFLARGNSGPGDSVYTWSSNPAATTPPPARARAAHAYDEIGDRVLVWGGDADGGDAATGLLSDLWALGPPLDPAYPALWTAIGQDSTPAPRAGASLAWWPRGSVTVMTPERFDPAAPPGSRFTRLDWATKYDQWLYPYMFLTRQGKVFYAAITDSCAVLDPVETSPTRGWGPKFGSLFSGASATALRPNLFMKSGGDQFPARTGVIEFDSLGQTTGWQSHDGMLPRIDHNTTMLPDGRALITGGDAQRKNTALAQRQPQIFDPETRTWSGPLASAPAIRGYHATALLLPDARILSWGGFINDTPRDSAEIYSPPYLFADAAGTLAPRPEVTAVQDTVAYGQVFTLCACDAPAVRSMALIRPGAPSHAFDQNARFVPLDFTRDPSGTAFAVQAPADGGVAPPGDYMLFVVDSAGVPSVARWVRVRAGAPVASVACPAPCVTDAPAPTARFEFGLAAPRPNPTLGSARLAFTLPGPTAITLEVLDAAGRRVRMLAEGPRRAGEHALTWDGRGSDGRRTPPGVYFLRLRSAEGLERSARLVRLP
jgi:hypothetical protein